MWLLISQKYESVQHLFRGYLSQSIFLPLSPEEFLDSYSHVLTDLDTKKRCNKSIIWSLYFINKDNTFYKRHKHVYTVSIKGRYHA